LLILTCFIQKSIICFKTNEIIKKIKTKKKKRLPGSGAASPAARPSLSLAVQPASWVSSWLRIGWLAGWLAPDWLAGRAGLWAPDPGDRFF